MLHCNQIHHVEIHCKLELIPPDRTDLGVCCFILHFVPFLVYYIPQLCHLLLLLVLEWGCLLSSYHRHSLVSSRMIVTAPAECWAEISFPQDCAASTRLSMIWSLRRNQRDQVPPLQPGKSWLSACQSSKSNYKGRQVEEMTARSQSALQARTNPSTHKGRSDNIV